MLEKSDTWILTHFVGNSVSKQTLATTKEMTTGKLAFEINVSWPTNEVPNLHTSLTADPIN